ncbi:MAG: hypothetical protein SFY69_00750 [Planctomycetota bacterium]|nr:hypothetical protein [Planctomycetota bacterium]
MTVDPLGLLARTGGGAARASADVPRLIEGESFGALLEKARAGEVSSSVPVRVAREAKVTLDTAQLSRLSYAADRAESEGVARAVVLIDGMALTMDVPTRTVTGALDTNSTRVRTGFDAVVTVGTRGETTLTREALLDRLSPVRRPGEDA